MIESPIFAIFVSLLFPLFSSLFALHKGIYESWGRTVLFLLFFALLSWLIMETAVLFQEKYWGIKAAEAEIFLSWGWLFIFFPILMFSFLFMVVLAVEKSSCGKNKIIAGVHFKSDILFGGLGGSSPFGYVEFKEDCFVCGVLLVGSKKIAYADAVVRMGKKFLGRRVLILDKRSGNRIYVYTLSECANKNILEKFRLHCVKVVNA